MGGEWSPVILGDLAKIEHGFAFAGEYLHAEGSGPAAVTPGNFHIEGGFNADVKRVYVGPEVQGYDLKAGDVVVTMTDLSKSGDTLGYAGVVPANGRWLHNQRIGKVVLRSLKKVFPPYLHWLMRSPAYRAEILGSATGSTVRHTAPSRIEAFAFALPPRREQERIAELLSTLDDKIALNRRMAGTLEGVARALFQSWFVDFDPVHAKAEGRDPGLPTPLAALFPSSLTPKGVPEGWGPCPLSTVATTARDTLDPATLGEQSILHLSIPAFDAGQRPMLESAAAIRSLKVDARRGMILFSKLNPETPRTWIVPEGSDVPMAASTEFIALTPANQVPLSFLWSLLCSPALVSRAAGLVTGTSKSHQRVQPASLMATEWPLPVVPVLAAFDEVVAPIISRIELSRKACDTLATLRDTLLPKLISGELRIADTERAVAAAA